MAFREPRCPVLRTRLARPNASNSIVLVTPCRGLWTQPLAGHGQPRWAMMHAGRGVAQTSTVAYGSFGTAAANSPLCLVPSLTPAAVRKSGADDHYAGGTLCGIPADYLPSPSVSASAAGMALRGRNEKTTLDAPNRQAAFPKSVAGFPAA